MSVYLTGRRLRPAAASRPASSSPGASSAGRGWTRANPYSLSAAPDGRSLRITVKDVGDGSARAARLRPGHPGAGRGAVRPAQRPGPHPPQGRADRRRRRHHAAARAGRGARLRARATPCCCSATPTEPLFARELDVLAARARAAGAAPARPPPRARTPGSATASAPSTTSTALRLLGARHRRARRLRLRPRALDRPRPPHARRPPACPPTSFHVESFGGDPMKTHRPLVPEHRVRRGAAVRLPHLDLGAAGHGATRPSPPPVGTSAGTTLGHRPASATASGSASAGTGVRQPRRRRPSPAPSRRPGGARCRCSSPSPAARSPTSRVLQYPSGNGKDQRDQRLRAADPDPGDARRAERRASTWSAARRSPATATSSRCRARSTRPGCDRDAGRRPTAPVRRARDGHADQPRAARPARRRRRAADAAWAAAMAVLREVDRVFSTYRADSVDLPARPRRDRARRTARPRSPRCSRSASRPRGESGGAFDVRRPAPDGAPCSTPAAWSRAGPSSAPPRACDALADTDFCLSAGGDMVCRTRRPGRAAVADRHRGPARPAPAGRRRPGAHRRRRHLRHRPPRRAHRRRAAPGAPPTGVASVTVVGRRPDLGRHRRHRGLRPGRATPLTGSRTRPGRTGLVVWADGRTELFGS